MIFLSSILYIIHLLAMYASLGLVIIRLCLVKGDEFLILAPCLGFIIYGIIVTILYRIGVSVEVVFLFGTIFAIPALIMALNYKKINGLLLLALAITFILSISPLLLGGHQFYAFQGNHWDHFDYLAAATSFRSYDYKNIDSLSPELLNSSNFLFWAREVLNIRPTVSLVFASSYHYYFNASIYGAYAYEVSLQLLVLFPAIWVVRKLKLGPLPSILSVVGLTCGFFVQYIFDINAWSQLASVSISLTAICLSVSQLTKSCSADGNADIGGLRKLGTASGEALILGLSWAGLLYYYPEALTVYGTALLGGMACAAWYMFVRRGLDVYALVPFTLGGLISIGLALGYIRGTIGWLVAQILTTSSTPVDWYKYFQKYLLIANLDGFQWASNASSDQGLARIIKPMIYVTDTFYGLLGLYVIVPRGAVYQAFEVIWIALLFLLMISMLYSCVKAVSNAVAKKNMPVVILAFCCFSSLILPVVLIGSGRYWAAGKGFSMASALVYILFLMPLSKSYSSGSRLMYALPFLFILTQVTWAAARPIEAYLSKFNEVKGVHYGQRYPSIQYPYLKTDFDWGLKKFEKRVKSCDGIVVDIADLFLDRYVQIWLSDLNVSWSSAQPLRMMSSPAPFGTMAPLNGANCLITDQKVREAQRFEDTVQLRTSGQ